MKIFVSYTSFRAPYWIASIFFAVLLILTGLWPSTAFAQVAVDGSEPAQFLGDIMCNAYYNFGWLAPLFSAIAFIAGGILIGSGLMALRDMADNPQSHPLHKGIARIAAGGLLMTLPYVAGCIITTLYLTPAPSGGGYACAVGITPTPSAGMGLDTLVTNLVGNITGPFISMISVAAYIMGILFIMIGLMKGAKYGSDPRASSTPHILGYLIIGALLIVAGQAAGDAIFTLFGVGTSDVIDYYTNTSRVMSWTAVATFGNEQFATVIAAALTFFQLIGILAFIRGLYIVKNAVEGSGQATMVQGFTHIVGGVLAINIYSILEVLDQTFGTGFLT